MTRAAILSCRELPAAFRGPHLDPEELFQDDARLAEAFAARGVRAERVSWDAETDWGRYDLAVIRSAWDYPLRAAEFLARLAAIGARTRVLNAPAVAAWNADKAYLLDLAARGAPVVPTALAAAGADLGEAARGRGWRDAVAKPRVGAGALGARRLGPGPEAAEGPMLVQPFRPSVASEGEWSFVYFAGRFRYAVLKTPKAGDFRVQATHGGRCRRAEPAPEDLARAGAVMETLSEAPLYARVDMVRGPEGRLELMELELIEPYLFFPLAPEAPALLADAALA